jgi:hypothetical protein
MQVEGRDDDSRGHCLVGSKPAVLHQEIHHWRAVLPASKEHAATQATVDRGLLISRIQDLELRPEERPDLGRGMIKKEISINCNSRTLFKRLIQILFCKGPKKATPDWQ